MKVLITVEYIKRYLTDKVDYMYLWQNVDQRFFNVLALDLYVGDLPQLLTNQILSQYKSN